MRVGMVLANQPFPPDIRVEKEADVLAGAGHEVLLLCRRGHGQVAEESVGNVRAIRHRVYPGSPLRRRLDSLLFLLTLDSPSWRGAIERLVTEHGAQALHCHDLPYARSTLKAGRKTGVPVVLDFHENYPAALRLWRRRWIDRVLFSGARASRFERQVVREADRVVVVVEEAKDRLVRLGADPARVVVFGNAEPAALVSADAPALPDRLHLVYVGGIAPHRGLETAVEAMPSILGKRPDAHLTIVGDGVSLEELEALARRLGLNDAVTFTGRLPKDEAMRYVEQATIGLVPHLKSPHTEATVPHKLFQYMAYGRPVLVSDCAPLARIVRETGAGAVFTAGDAGSFAETALALGSDPARLRETSRAGRSAAATTWSMESDSADLLELYNAL
ncbi:glycosyltransferase family 4 protein [Anaerosoma tenue]|uniref:glycosyltransferase family 4 protein n=1 Tax=Anaerosoma tenue TaxID=2933588 RepID=UPI002260EABC|nr:glycosyltransferase family 4 protein [Anaerosoma tenue]MCK8114588.1 glycosyltransferase family 4 protein [Anaerosoma tenue]